MKTSSKCATVDGSVLRLVNDLIGKLKDREAAFANAARLSEGKELEQTFAEFERERARFASELQDELERLGARAEDSGTIVGAVRRGLASFRSEVSGEGVQPVFEECHLQEFFAAKQYEDLLEDGNLPPGVPSLLRTQLRRTRVAQRFLRDLGQGKTPPEPQVDD